MADKDWTSNHTAYAVGCTAAVCVAMLLMGALLQRDWAAALMMAGVLILIVSIMVPVYRSLASKERR